MTFCLFVYMKQSWMGCYNEIKSHILRQYKKNLNIKFFSAHLGLLTPL